MNHDAREDAEEYAIRTNPHPRYSGFGQSFNVDYARSISIRDFLAGDTNGYQRAKGELKSLLIEARDKHVASNRHEWIRRVNQALGKEHTQFEYNHTQNGYDQYNQNSDNKTANPPDGGNVADKDGGTVLRSVEFGFGVYQYEFRPYRIAIVKRDDIPTLTTQWVRVSPDRYQKSNRFYLEGTNNDDLRIVCMHSEKDGVG